MLWWQDLLQQYVTEGHAFTSVHTVNMGILNHSGHSKSESLHCNVCTGMEDKYQTILAYYKLLSASMRNSLHPMLIQRPELNAHIWPPLNDHPTCLGTRYSDFSLSCLL